MTDRYPTEVLPCSSVLNELGGVKSGYVNRCMTTPPSCNGVGSSRSAATYLTVKTFRPEDQVETIQPETVQPEIQGPSSACFRLNYPARPFRSPNDPTNLIRQRPKKQGQQSKTTSDMKTDSKAIQAIVAKPAQDSDISTTSDQAGIQPTTTSTANLGFNQPCNGVGASPGAAT